MVSGESVLKTLIELLESQEQIKITAVIKKNAEKEDVNGKTI